MSESLAEAAMRFQKARFYLHCWALTPEETQVLQEMLEKKGNKPMDEELFSKVEVDIDEFTREAMKLQVAVIDAEARLKDAQRRWDDVEKTVWPVKQRLTDAEKALEKARGGLEHHLNSVRGLNVTVPAPPGWGQNVYRVGERDA